MSKEYDDYLEEHIGNVRKAYKWMCENIPEVVSFDKTINNYLAWHDVSKYAYDEYEAYDSYFYGDKKAPGVKEAFDLAWLKHIHKNEHHWQHYILIEDDSDSDGKMRALEMPEEDIIEMICDWMSFSIKKKDMREVIKWYEEHSDKMILAPKTRERVVQIIKAIDEKTIEDIIEHSLAHGEAIPDEIIEKIIETEVSEDGCVKCKIDFGADKVSDVEVQS